MRNVFQPRNLTSRHCRSSSGISVPSLILLFVTITSVALHRHRVTITSTSSSTIFCHAFPDVPVTKTAPSTTSSSLSPTSTSTPNKVVSSKIIPPSHVWPKLVVGGPEDPAMGLIEKSQRTSGRPYGSFLDAGTGSYSLRWFSQILYRHSDPDDPLHMENYVAVTADEGMRREVVSEAEDLGVLDYGDIVIGNWAAGTTIDEGDDSYLCKGKMFDTILADYLLGAVDHFAPFFQDRLFPRLVRHLKPGGRMYLTGLNPIPEPDDVSVNDAGEDHDAARLFCQITKLRDACILLTGKRPYREHPVEWVERHLPLAGLDVLEVEKFPKVYNYRAMALQLDAARSTLPFIKDEDVREVMRRKITRLDEESREACEKCPDGKFVLGFDWIIAAEKPTSS